MKTHTWTLDARGYFVADAASGLPFPMDRIDARLLVGFAPKDWQVQLDLLMDERVTYALIAGAAADVNLQIHPQ